MTAAAKKNAASQMKSRYSTLMSVPSGDDVVDGPPGVERMGGRGVRAAQVATVDRGQRLGRRVPLAGDRVDLLTELEVLVEDVLGDASDLEVHHRVVLPAEFGT